MCVLSAHLFLLMCMPGVQKRMLDPWNWSLGNCELPCGCWELNTSPLEEHLVLLKAEPYFQRHNFFLIKWENIVLPEEVEEV